MTSPPLPHPKHLLQFKDKSSLKDGVRSSYKSQQHFLRCGPDDFKTVLGLRSMTSCAISTLDLTMSMYLSFIELYALEK